MNISIFIFMLFCFQLLYWFIGRRASKNLQGEKDYFLAEKKVTFFPLMMTFLATQVGGGIILGSADEAYHYGWAVLFYPLGVSLGLILLGLGIGRRLANFQVMTVAQIFEVVYASEWLKRIASVLSIVSLFMILVAQIIASSKFLVSLGIVNVPLFIAFWAIVVIYTAQGGLRAVISTDMVQAALFSLIFLFSFGFALYTNPELVPMQMIGNHDFSLLSSKWAGWLLMPMLFMMIEQDMGQRCFAGSSPGVVSKASLVAGICTMVVCLVPVFFGCIAKAMHLAIPEGGSVLMTVIAKTTNPWVTALVGCAILAAIISTATSLINAISSNLSNDFKLSFFQKANKLKMIQMVTCLISICAIFFAFYSDNIVALLIQSYELSVSCLFVPIFIALFKKKGNALSAFLGVIFGAVCFFAFRIVPTEFPKEISSVLISLLGYSCGEVITYFTKRTTNMAQEGI